LKLSARKQKGISMTCKYCRQEDDNHRQGCPTLSPENQAKYDEGYRAYDWKYPIPSCYWHRLNVSYLMGYHAAVRYEQESLAAAGNRYSYD
jgi:hypothetical protein